MTKQLIFENVIEFDDIFIMIHNLSKILANYFDIEKLHLMLHYNIHDINSETASLVLESLTNITADVSFIFELDQELIDIHTKVDSDFKLYKKEVNRIDFIKILRLMLFMLSEFKKINQGIIKLSSICEPIEEMLRENGTAWCNLIDVFKNYVTSIDINFADIDLVESRLIELKNLLFCASY